MSKVIDLTGQKFGRLTVVGRELKGGASKEAYWKCKCECGGNTTVSGYSLRRGNTKSCGCLKKEKASVINVTHGFSSKEALYTKWASMKARCYNSKATNYKNYGGRGVTICGEWLNDYVAFRDWAIGNGYSIGLTIDRINVNGNYCPDNCRWLSNKGQANNKRTNRVITMNGVAHTLSEWSDIYKINQDTVSERMKRGWSIEDALILPLDNRGRKHD